MPVSFCQFIRMKTCFRKTGVTFPCILIFPVVFYSGSRDVPKAPLKPGPDDAPAFEIRTRPQRARQREPQQETKENGVPASGCAAEEK